MSHHCCLDQHGEEPKCEVDAQEGRRATGGNKRARPDPNAPQCCDVESGSESGSEIDGVSVESGSESGLGQRSHLLPVPFTAKVDALQ